jgi:hypothetical protein
MRLHAQTTLIESGFVRIPENASWLAEYLHEMTVFPKGKHDDQVDSTAQFLDWYKRPFPNQGYYEWLRQKFCTILAEASVLAYCCSHILAFDVQAHRGVDELRKMGAKSPCTARLPGCTGVEAPAWRPRDGNRRPGGGARAGGLSCQGTTVLDGLDHLDRGYERMAEKLVACGAAITRSMI